MMKTKLKFLFFLLIPWFLSTSGVTGQPGAALDTIWEVHTRTIFNDIYMLADSLPHIVIETDLDRLVATKFEEEYQPAVVSWAGNEGKAHRWEVKLRARGNRRKEVCHYPPVKLNYDDTELTTSGYIPFDKIKIVNQCRNARSFVDYLLKEYQAYRLYNVLTPQSFRARLVRLTYLDTDDDNKATEMYSIFLEPEEEMAARLKAQPVELSVTYFVHLDERAANRLSLFQYMIGNTDWNVHNLHNLVTLKLPEVRKLTPIPYDFDYSGLVGSPYAIPHESLPIRSVRDRYHKGPLMSEEELDPLIERFKVLKPQFLEVPNEVKAIDEKCAEETKKFLEYFFDLLDKPKLMKRIFVDGRQ
jgi:hypothetical protein